MIFTRRLFLLVGVGVVPLALSAWLPSLAFAAVIWNTVTLALIVIDFLNTPAPERAFACERRAGEVLSVGVSQPVGVLVSNRTPRRFHITVRDEPPPEFEVEGGLSARQIACSLEPFESRLALEYVLVPRARGDYRFGDIYLQVVGLLGLVVRQGKLDMARQVAVYPDLRAVEDHERMLRKAHRARQGMRRQRTTGVGREFASLREYTPDDEYRVVDWKATARRGKIIARTFEAERSQDILLLLDLGRLMRQEIARTQKLDHVVNAALRMAHAVASADDRIGLLTFADTTRVWLPPRRGRASVSEIQKALYAASAEPVEADYRAAFRFLSARWRKRSLVVLFTDLADPESSSLLLSEIVPLSRSHLVVCVVVRDPLVAQRARQMPERTEQVYEKSIAEEIFAERRYTLELLKKRGMLVVDAEPKDLAVDLINRYLEVKARALL